MKNNLVKIKDLCFFKLIILTLSVSYGQGKLDHPNDTIHNSFNVEYTFEKNLICNKNDNCLEIDTLLVSDVLLILYNECCRENFLYNIDEKKLFNLGNFSCSMGFPPTEVSFIRIGKYEIGILYHFAFFRMGFTEEYYFLYSYHIDKGFVLRLCVFSNISAMEIKKIKNKVTYNEYKIDIENKKMTVYEYIPYKYKNKKYKTSTMECCW